MPEFAEEHPEEHRLIVEGASTRRRRCAREDVFRASSVFVQGYPGCPRTSINVGTTSRCTPLRTSGRYVGVAFRTLGRRSRSQSVQVLASFGPILMWHLDEEVKTLRGDNLRRYYT